MIKHPQARACSFASCKALGTHVTGGASLGNRESWGWTIDLELGRLWGNQEKRVQGHWGALKQSWGCAEGKSEVGY